MLEDDRTSRSSFRIQISELPSKPRRLFWTRSCRKRSLHGSWKLRDGYRRRIFVRLHYALGRLARGHHGDAASISLRKTGNCHWTFPAGDDKTASEGTSLCRPVLVGIRGGGRDDRFG